ncbi:MAG: hypothetical protein JNL54_20000 [Kineosporiaceae bacterium]|nr:hypothetical protein [Kineosporiaceae bacterium]
MSIRRITIGLTALTAMMLAWPTGPVAAVPAAIAPATPPVIHGVAHRAHLRADDSITLAVRYTCTDRPAPAGVVNYLSADVVRPSSAHYVVGYRGDVGGLLPATCTGTPQTAVLRLRRSTYALPGQTSPRGRAIVTVTITPRTTPDSGGWYVETGSPVTITGRVSVIPRGHHHRHR